MTNNELKTRLQKTLDFLSSELSQISTGRASPSMLESVKVPAYGGFMSMREVGSISVTDSNNLMVTPWDKGLVSAVAKAIRDSDLNLNPAVDGEKVRVPVPGLTEERRQEFTKIASTKVETAKNSMRSVRQDAMKDIDKDFSNKSISEDEKFTLKEAVEDILKEFIGISDEMGDKKKKDLMTL